MSGSGSAPQLDERAVEAAAREAFWTDDLGGHIKGKHTWDSIPEEGRENYRTMIRAALRAYLAASSGALELDLTDDEAAHAPFPCDVVVVFESPEVAQAAVDWIVGKRPGPYPEDIVVGRYLDRAIRAIRSGLRVQERRGSDV